MGYEDFDCIPLSAFPCFGTCSCSTSACTLQGETTGSVYFDGPSVPSEKCWYIQVSVTDEIQTATWVLTVREMRTAT